MSPEILVGRGGACVIDLGMRAGLAHLWEEEVAASSQVPGRGSSVGKCASRSLSLGRKGPGTDPASEVAQGIQCPTACAELRPGARPQPRCSPDYPINELFSLVVDIPQVGTIMPAIGVITDAF